MNKPNSCLSDEKSSSENFSYISSESMPLEENLKKDAKSKNVTKKYKFISILATQRKRKEDNIRKKIKTSALKAIIKKNK